MRMRGIMLAAALGMMASAGSSSAYSQMRGETSPFAFEMKVVGSKPNKVSQKKRRLKARRLGH